MCRLFNNIITTGDVPRSMKSAKEIPIHISKDKTDMENYRPIFPSLSKILEKNSS